MREEDYQRQAYEHQHQEEQEQYDTAHREQYEREGRINDAIRALKWNPDNCQPVNPDLQSDLFNINTNAIKGLEDLIAPKSPQTPFNPDELPF